MKRTSTILATFLLLLCASTWVSAQVLLTENFNYTAGDSLTTHGWSAHSGAGTNVETITTGLSYTGYIGSAIGGASTLAATGQDVNRTWTSYPNGVTSGNVYYSVLVNLDSAQTAGDYFFHLYKSSSTFTARLFAKKAFTSNNFSFGIARSSTTANIAYSDSIYSFGTTYLIVVKYSIIAGATNDTVAMWINPNITGTEPAPTALEMSADRTTADVDTVYGVAIRQGTAANAPRGKVDGIRVVKSWKSINNKLAVLSKNSINYSNITLGSSATDSVIVKNDDATSISISSVTSGAPVFGVSPTSVTIAPGTSQKFVVTYTPIATVTTSSAIAFISDAASSPDSVFITGNAIQPGFTISTKSYSFGNVYKDSTVIDSVTVTNAIAAGSLVIDSVTSSNPVFTVGPTSATLAVSAAKKFGVSFKPTAAGVASSFIVFYNNGGLLRDTMRVSGNGIIKAPAFSVTPTLKDFHVVLVGSPWKDSVTVKNTGYDSLFISGITSSDPTFTVTPTTARLDSQASKKFFITFTPTALGAKSSLIIFTSNVTEVKDTVKAIGTGISIVTIAEARKDTNNDLIADHSVIHDTLAITGVITTPNMGASAGQVSYFMQDATGGIDAFAFGAAPVTYSKGDSVLVIGTAAQYRGLVEFTPVTLDTLHFQILKHNATLPTPKRLTLRQFVTSAESYEGQLIELDTLYKATGTWPAAGIGNVSIFLTNASKTDTVQMFLDIDAGIGGSPEPIYPINVKGTLSQYTSAATVYNNGYEIVPRDTSDIRHQNVVSVKDLIAGIPTVYELQNNYPNPFNPSTTIMYGLPQQSHVTVTVYSVLGQVLATLVNEVQAPSYYRVVWYGQDKKGGQVSSGVYFFRIVAQSTDGKTQPFVQVKKMMLMK